MTQMVIKVTAAPVYFTPVLDTLFISGTFNGWDPGNADNILTKHDDGTYTSDVSGADGDTIEFKFTRGDWARGETKADGSFLPNRVAEISNGDTLEVTIENWQDMIGNHTITGDVIMLDYNFYMPQLGRFRRIWIYLPPDYYTSTNYYPVIYMNDGQNIFDDATSFIGEWDIDGTVENLINTGHTPAIVVGIANGELDRIDEYSPWINATYGGGEGDQYADFIVNTLKPYIDSNYRTLPDRENTATGGSSMGGLISYYMTLAYDSVFAKAFVFSPSFWFSDEVLTFAENYEKEFHTKIYITAGEHESETIVSEIDNIVSALQDDGFTDDEIISVIRSDGAHSEWFWKREYDDAYLWLFEDVLPLSVSDVEHQFNFTYDIENQTACIYSENMPDYKLFDLQGKIVDAGRVYENKISFSKYTPGIYLLFLSDGIKTETEKIVIL